MDIIKFSVRTYPEYEWTPEVLLEQPESQIFRRVLVAAVFVSFFEKLSFRISKATKVYIDDVFIDSIGRV